ncbi:rho GTPase-activating protein 12 [Folsomia candida]|uniref:rho GTPase-activating protein 12 n=1 Tax=Folsomia candida TaxID=158441 RepID=UPI000B8FD0B4|nr:rho GTPase-activating protein 12 [Folsomia candida]XP_035706416.1 rho GTPase-activating protein 12 [Folsomia candida]XP_035706417.1 rho GTPase-activating protein 12 [Folsomia candida]
MASATHSSLQVEQNNPLHRRPIALLKVAYDYDYDYKTRKVSVRAGELLHLLQKTNEHWWKVIRPGVNNKPFFVPAQYVTEVSHPADQSPKENGQKLPLTKFHSLDHGSPNLTPKNGSSNKERESVTKSKSKESSFFSFSKSGKSSKVTRNEGSRASHREKNSKQQQQASTTSSKKISSTSSSGGGGKLKNWSASLEELSKQIVFPGLASESVADLTFATRAIRDERKGGHQSCEPFGPRDVDSTTAMDDMMHSVSFGRERSSFSSFHCDDNRNQNVHSNSINKCLTFRNPTFNKSSEGSADSKCSTSEEKLETGSSSHDISGSPGSLSQEGQSPRVVNNMESDYTISHSASGTITKEPTRLPATPPINSPVRRFLADDWAEYQEADSKRYFYYNSKSKITSWKPPRTSSSSSNKKSDEHLGGGGSSLSDGSANASSLEKSLESLENIDLLGSPNLSLEAEPSVSAVADRASHSFSDNNDTTASNILNENSGESRSRSSESITMKEEQGPSGPVAEVVAEIPIPEGWERQWDTASQQFCYVNKITGARWFSSTDSDQRVYYYEEHSSNSSWFLPVPDVNTTHNLNQSPNTKEGNTSVSSETASLQEKSLDSSKPVVGLVKKHRHSAGEVVDRNLKTKSLLISSSDLRKHEFDKSGSLPRSLRTIWANGMLDVIREGPIARSKITENGKKLRKSWSVIYCVLTESHLSLFKDQKSFLMLTKTEVEIELNGATVEWTDERSSRKNVFQLSTLSDLQMLFQLDDKSLAQEWFESIRYVTEKNDSTLDISMRLRSNPESPDNLLDPPVGERKISSRLNRNKSTKLRITTVEDKDKIKIKESLRRFFSRRPPRESLVKKGIYKDESVFGCSLEKLCTLEKEDVPRFVQECIVAIESRPENLKTDGIYRASGNLSQVQKIRLQVDQNNLACLFQEEDVHVLAGCLKLFFRELKEPLIPSELFEKALQACHASNRKEKLNRLGEIVNCLIRPNKCTLQALLRHLLKVAAYSEFNRMQIPNLAIVFGPTLMYAAETQNMATDLMQQNLVIEALLLEYESIFQ